MFWRRKFGLRTLANLTISLAVSFSLFGHYYTRYLIECSAAESIQAHGGKVGWTGRRDGWPDSLFDSLRFLHRVDFVSLSGESGLSTKLFEAITKFHSLKTLKLDYTPADDRYMKAISTLPNLEDLDLKNTSVTDDGIMHLKNLNQLRKLNLQGNNVSYGALSKLCRELDLIKERNFIQRHARSTCVDLGGHLLRDDKGMLHVRVDRQSDLDRIAVHAEKIERFTRLYVNGIGVDPANYCVEGTVPPPRKFSTFSDREYPSYSESKYLNN